MYKITIAHGHSSIEILHSLIPLFLASKELKNWNWKFIDYKFSNIFESSGDLIILVRKYHDGKLSDKLMISEIKKLKKNYTKVIYFDDSASASGVFNCILPYLDQYWKRSILKNKNLYKKKLYGGHLFSEYYHEKFLINDSQVYFNNSFDGQQNLEKIKVAWNIGVGLFPLNKINLFDKNYIFFRKILTAMSAIPRLEPLRSLVPYYLDRIKENLKKEVNLSSKKKIFSSRFDHSSYRESIAFQRKIINEKIKYKKEFLKGLLTRKDFTNETFEVYGLISPFGWGEICYRDYEAIIGGALLIKPDMSHIHTWPNIYNENNYFSISWDCDEIDNIDNLFDQIIECQDKVNSSRLCYLNSLNKSSERCILMIKETLGIK